MSEQTPTTNLGDDATNSINLLLPEHVQDLQKSGLSIETIARLGFAAVRPHDLKVHGATSAYRIPYFDLDGQPLEFDRSKLFPPVTTRDGRTQKYYQPPGTVPHLYVPPLVDWRKTAGDASIGVVITEGEKKAAKACQEGFSTIGISGIWNWCEKLANGERMVLPMIDQFVWEGRRVEIVPDSDAWRPEKLLKVLGGFYALGMELVRRGAIVVFVRLPEPSGTKVGFDDWLVKEYGSGRSSWEHLERYQPDEPQLRQVAKWWQGWDRRTRRTETTGLLSLIEKVNGIRLDTAIRSWERRREIADLILKDLKRRGKLIRSSDGDLLFFEQEDRTLEPINGRDFLARLYDRFGLNSAEDETRFVEREITTAATVKGDRMEVHRFSHWSEENRKLYVSMGGGSVAVLNGKDIIFADNGVDGILFREEVFEPLQMPDLEAVEQAFDWLFDGLSLAGDDRSVSHALVLLKVWALALFFPERLKVRPILVLVGEQGSGKTSFGRRLGLALFGPGFEVSSFRSDPSGEPDFLAAATNQRLLIYDNADSRIRWLPDHLARLSTGAVIQRRELYTTNTLKTYRPNCFCMLTTREPRWNRDDVSSRLLPIRMETIPQTKTPEVYLQRQILARRAWIWGGLLKVLNKTVAELLGESKQFVSGHRLADYHAFGQGTVRAIGCSDIFEEAIANLDNSQQNLLVEGNPAIDLFVEWSEANLSPGVEVRIAVRDLFAQLRTTYEGRNQDFPFKDTYSLGTWLGKNKRLIETQCGIKVSKPLVEGKRHWVFEKIN